METNEILIGKAKFESLGIDFRTDDVYEVIDHA